MPEYPDIMVYIERLEALVTEQTLEQIRFASPFFLRTAEPPIKSIYGAIVRRIEHIGKRIVFVIAGEAWSELLIGSRLPGRGTLYGKFGRDLIEKVTRAFAGVDPPATWVLDSVSARPRPKK